MDISSSLTIETHMGKSGELQIVVSIPGRDGALTRRWKPAGCGRIDVRQWEDAQAAVIGSLSEWFYLASGAQVEFPFG